MQKSFIEPRITLPRATSYHRQPDGSPAIGNVTGNSSSPVATNVTRHVLDNGLTLLIKENHFNRTVAIAGYLKAGSVFDPGDLYGCSSFTAYMLAKGTATRTWEEIAEATESVGAHLGISGNMEMVSIEGRLLSKDFDRVLDVLNELLREPTFPEIEIEKHRHQLYSWLKSLEDDTQRVVDRLLQEMIYPADHPYHRRPQGTEESIERIQKQALVDFHTRYYRPNTLILAVVGDVHTADVINRVETIMGNWTPGTEDISLAIPTTEFIDRKTAIKSMMDKSQVDIVMGHKGIARSNPDFEAFNLMNRVLGGSAGIGRLFGKVRDVQGLAYSVWSSFALRVGEGPFYAGAGVNPENVEKAIDSILTEIELIRTEGLTPQELSDAQNLIVGNFVLTLETNQGICYALLNSEFYGLGLDYMAKHESIYRHLTLDQVNAAAEKYLHPERCCIAIAGPYQNEQMSK